MLDHPYVVQISQLPVFRQYSVQCCCKFLELAVSGATLPTEGSKNRSRRPYPCIVRVYIFLASVSWNPMASEAFIMPVLFSVLNLRPEAIGVMAVSWSACLLPGSSGMLKPAD